jgi:tRNA(fMet)-specific endonuclease VapC
MIHLDTNAVIAVLNPAANRIRDKFDRRLRLGGGVAISVIVIFELRFGIAKSALRAANAARLDEFLALPIEVLAFEQPDAEEAGEIRVELERIGRPIGSYDVLIAAQARRHAATLVTANYDEFARVPGLAVEDWSLASG